MNNRADDDLWHKAVQSLSIQDREEVDLSKGDKLGVLADILEIVEEKKATCLEKRWKYKKGDKEIVIRDQLEKVIAWVEKFKAIGDVAVQYDAAHASLPWAGIRLVLQIAVNDSETFGAMVEAIEYISNLITRCAILENLYLRGSGLASATDHLKDAIVKLYISVLRYLCRARKYFARSTAKRMLLSSVQSAQTGVHTYLDIIRKKQASVDAFVHLIEVEHIKESNSRSQHLETLLLQLQQPILRSAVQLSELHDHLKQSERLTLLNWLSKVPYKTIHKSIGKDVLSESGEWILQNAQFADWNRCSASSTLFLHGIPGSGKTKLMYNIVERHLTSSFGTAPPLTAYFYCARNPAEPQRSNPEEIMRSILRQLSSSRPDLPIRGPVVEAFQERQREAASDGGELTPPTVDDCVRLILDLLQRDPAFIFIDALDECDVFSRGELFWAINTITKESGNLVKALVSSRDDCDISCHFSNSQKVRIRAEDNGRDIERFVKVSLAKALSEKRILNGQLSHALEAKIVATIIGRADGMFRWTSLQIQMLCDRQRIKIEEDIEEELGSLPQGLKESYDKIYHRVLSLAAPSRILAIRSIRWLLCAQSLMTPEDLISAISLGSHEVTFSAANIIDICCNLVVMDDLGVFHFAHLSVREYFESLDSYSPNLNHEMALHRCLDVYLRLNDQSRPHTHAGEDQKLKSYASMYWTLHYEYLESSGISQDLESKFRTFLFGRDGTSSAYQDWTFDAWNRSLYLVTLGSTELGHNCTDTHRHKLGSMSNASHTPLFLACCFGWSWILKDLVAYSTENWTYRNQKGESAFFLAALWGHESVLQILITMSEKAKDVTEDLEEALYAGVESKKVDVVRVLMKQGVTGQTRTTFGESALQAAARQEDTTILQCLLEGDVRINVEDFCEVCYVALDECRSEALRILLAKAIGFDTHWHFNLLNWMAFRDNDELTPLLLQQTLDKSIMVDDCRVGQNLTNILPSISKSLTHTSRQSMDEEANPTRHHRATTLFGEMESIEFVLDSFSPKYPRDDELTGLHLAAQESDRDLVSLMLKYGADINGLDETGRTPLLVSLESGNPSMALFLLERGASVLNADQAGRSPVLMCAAIENDQDVATDTLQALLSKGADLNLPWLFEGWLDFTALDFAVIKGNYKSVELLLDHAARTNITCDRFAHPLHFATLEPHSAILRLLLERGADPNRTISFQAPKALSPANDSPLWQGCTPLHIAVANDHDDSVEQLLQSFAYASARNSIDTTPLHMAAYTGSFSITELLISHGADTEAKSKSFCDDDDVDDLTPMHVAVRCRHISIVEQIIDARGNVNAKDSKGQTPLHHALRYDSPSPGIIILLLKAGAAIGCQDELGETPTQIVLDRDLRSVKTLFDAYAPLAAGENSRERSAELDSEAEWQTLLDIAANGMEWSSEEAESSATSEADPAETNKKDDDVCEDMSSDIQSTTFTDLGEDTWSILPSLVPIPFREVSIRYMP